MWATASIDRQSPALVGLISARFVITMTLIHIRITAEHLLDRYGIGTLYALVRCIDEPVVALKDTSPRSIERVAEEGRKAGREVISHRPRGMMEWQTCAASGRGSRLLRRRNLL